jgi:uncharacterized membrane protein
VVAHWERHLERWTNAGLIPLDVAARVRAYELDQGRHQGLRWPVRLAIALGALLLGAGVLLFVAAHWDTLSPGTRFGLVLLLIGVFHITAALTMERFAVLAIALHAVGTICLGAGIFLAGQIFHLEEHWPGGVLLWALGAWIGWTLLRDWPHAGLIAVLTPLWLSSEWLVATRGAADAGKILAEGVLLLAITYLTALSDEKSHSRKTLAWIGGLMLIPAAFAVIVSGTVDPRPHLAMRGSIQALGWAGALGLPLLLAWGMRLRSAWMNVVAALWVIGLGTMSLPPSGMRGGMAADIGRYCLCALGAIGLIVWGLHEARKERINLGVAGFAVTVLCYYFSSVMDKLERSMSLIGLGFLFLLGGWALEKARRHLMARVEIGSA